MAKKPELVITIKQAMMNYVDTVKLARSEHTARAYKNALNEFGKVLVDKSLDPQTTSVEKLTENLVSAFAAYLNTFSPATEHLYLQAVKGFYEFVDSEGFTEINVSRVRILIRLRSRRPGIRISQFPVDDIERLLGFVLDAHNLKITNDTNEKLRAMRDRAFLLALADTGLRVHEACNLRRGDVDWNEHQALIVGKGNIQAVVRFTSRSINAIKDYLSLRASIDGASGRPLPSLPIFARHDKGVGKKIKPITPTTGRNIVAERVEEILGKDSVGTITPHSFRHYFVTTALKGSGNLKFAQELARHKNIQVTQRYAHLSDDALDKGYYEIFEKKSQQTTD